MLHLIVVQTNPDKANHTSTTFSITLRRQVHSYVIQTFVQLFSKAMLMTVIFWLPVDSCKRMEVGINLLLCLWVDYLRVTDCFGACGMASVAGPSNSYPIKDTC